jgi:hypothetical protein
MVEAQDTEAEIALPEAAPAKLAYHSETEI